MGYHCLKSLKKFQNLHICIIILLHYGSYPNEKIIELKSLKSYLQQFRDIVISYERLINVIYDDIIKMILEFCFRL